MALTSTCRENGGITVSTGNRLTIEEAGDFQRLLREGLEAAQTVAVEFGEELSIDITGIQLLCSACKNAAASGGNLVIRGPRPPALDELIETLGAARHAVCKQNSNSDCIWFGGAR